MCIAAGQRQHLGGSVLADESFSADRTAFRRQLVKQFGQYPDAIPLAGEVKV